MSGRILLVRSGSSGPEDASLGSDVTVLHTHVVEPSPATLVVSSKETLRVLPASFPARFSHVIGVGEGTGDFLRRLNTGEARLVVPEVPGAAGVLHLLRKSPEAFPKRVLWPHGSDAAAAPFEEIRALGFSLSCPVVYSKRALSPEGLAKSAVADFAAGRFGAVAVGSTAGLDVLLAAVPSPPPVRWGVLGPETARAVVARNLPAPVVPPRARLADLLDLLRKETP